MVHQYSQSLIPDLSSFSKGWHSSSVTALRDNTSFFLRQARCPVLHLAKALSFSVCAQERFAISASRSSVVTRVRFGRDSGNQYTQKRNRIEAIFNRLPCTTTSHERSKIPISVSTQSCSGDEKASLGCCQLSSVRDHESSASELFSRTALNPACAQNGSVANRSSRSRFKRAKHGMFGHPARNAFCTSVTDLSRGTDQ